MTTTKRTVENGEGGKYVLQTFSLKGEGKTYTVDKGERGYKEYSSETRPSTLEEIFEVFEAYKRDHPESCSRFVRARKVD